MKITQISQRSHFIKTHPPEAPVQHPILTSLASLWTILALLQYGNTSHISLTETNILISLLFPVLMTLNLHLNTDFLRLHTRKVTGTESHWPAQAFHWNWPELESSTVQTKFAKPPQAAFPRHVAIPSPSLPYG